MHVHDFSSVAHSLVLPFSLKFEFEFLLDLVRTSSIPVVMCVATLTGLAPQRKSALFQDFMQIAVRFRDSKSELADRYRTRLEERCSKEGLSSFNFNILGKFPFSDLTWLLATKRSSISLCFLCCLLQALELRGIPIESLNVPEGAFDIKKEELLGTKHGEWLFYEATKRLNAFKVHQENLKLLKPGVTLLNVFNIGPSKAAVNFLPFLGQYCKRSLPLFFVSAPGSTGFNEPLEPECFKECETAVNHLLNAYVAKKTHMYHLMKCQSFDESAPTMMQHTSSTTRLDAIKRIFTENGLKPDFKSVDLSNMKDTKRILERMVIRNMAKYVIGLPVRWVFLRSLLQALNISLITKSDIKKLATSSNIGIDASEVKAFLTTFTSFASLLYIPSLTDVVLVDIERFTDCLDKVFSYDDSSDACSSGFVTEAAIDQLAEAEKLNADLFKAVLKSFYFAIPVTASEVVDSGCFSNEEAMYYYVPSMRSSEATNGPQYSSLYIQITSTILGNVQVHLVRQILKHNNCHLIPYKPINTSIIRVQALPGNKDVDVTIIDHKSFVELRLNDGCSEEAYKATCSLIVKACATAMNNMVDVKYQFMLRCVDADDDHKILPDDNHKILPDDSSLCENCKANPATSLQKLWKNAVLDFPAFNNLPA